MRVGRESAALHKTNVVSIRVSFTDIVVLTAQSHEASAVAWSIRSMLTLKR